MSPLSRGLIQLCDLICGNTISIVIIVSEGLKGSISGHTQSLEEWGMNVGVMSVRTFSVVPVMTWSPSYVDLMYIP